MTEARCKCGAKILHVEDVTGTKQVLDARRHPIFERVVMPDGATVQWIRVAAARISHFATCPNAGEFSGRNKEKPGG